VEIKKYEKDISKTNNDILGLFKLTVPLIITMVGLTYATYFLLIGL
tara:strand:+ start:6713 stop:6850 length:138 start_codon:yes stop_codon:yes gene_type:complete